MENSGELPFRALRERRAGISAAGVVLNLRGLILSSGLLIACSSGAFSASSGAGGQGGADSGASSSSGSTAPSGGSIGAASAGGPSASAGRAGSSFAGGADDAGGAGGSAAVAGSGSAGGVSVIAGSGGTIGVTAGAGGAGPDCTMYTMRCVSAGTQMCDSSGHWQSAQTCPFGCTCSGSSSCTCTGTCVPGSAECVTPGPGNNYQAGVQTCDAHGFWQTGATCSGVTGSCVNGQCVDTCGGTCSQDVGCPANPANGRPGYSGQNWQYQCVNAACGCVCPSPNSQCMISSGIFACGTCT
jgi:hypothetical protein